MALVCTAGLRRHRNQSGGSWVDRGTGHLPEKVEAGV